MFKFKNKSDKEVPKKEKTLTSKLDKLVMGAIIGGAIGSVVGASMHPKVRKRAGELIDKHGFSKEKRKGILKRILSRIFQRGKKKNLKEIPRETMEFTIEDEDRERIN